MRLLAATNNKHKLEEIRRILAPAGFTVLSLSDVALHAQVEETGDTFAQNARLKAEAVFALSEMPTLSDDSGLCVGALGGRPGVYSARYGGDGLDDAGRTQKLLCEMERVPQEERGARFVCAVCCILDKDTVLETSGECKGSIGFAPLGAGGFGYDPVFMVGGHSYAGLPGAEKDTISHRGRALQNLCVLLAQHRERMI